jgi:EmrB/QacA subfamily drug resistance transporter
MTTEHDTPDPRRWWILAILSLSLLVISLDNTILNVALPSIEGGLGASSSQLQWIVDSYILVFAGLLLTAGSLGDRFGRRRALVFGLVVFGAGSGLSALAGSSSELIASRALMGIGGAFIMPTTLSILTHVFPPSERPKAIGIWAAVMGIGVAIGPVVGGWLLEHFNWTSVFLVNLPVVAIGIAGALAIIPESRNPDEAKLDPIGAGLSIAGLSAVVYAIIEAPAQGWTHPLILAVAGAGVLLLAAFARWELHTPAPMLDVRLFRNGAFSGASAAIALVSFSLFGSIFFLTQYLQGVLGFTALEAGIRTLPVAAGLIIAAPLSQKLAQRVGARPVVTAGLTIVGAALATMSLIDAESGYALVGVSMALFGIGMGATMAPATESIMTALPRSHAGVGSAMNDTTRMVGGSFGVAVLGSLLSSGYGDQMDAATADLPAGTAAAASDSLGATAAVAARLGGENGSALLDAGRAAFASSMGDVAIVAAAVALTGAAIAFAAIPGRSEARAGADSELVHA